jgi:hypothetical protein
VKREIRKLIEVLGTEHRGRQATLGEKVQPLIVVRFDLSQKSVMLLDARA